MQLNEIHNPHEHASVSLKVILLVFAVILVGVLGYLVWQQYSQTSKLPTDSEDNSSASDNIDQTNADTLENGDQTTTEVKSADTTGWKKYSNSAGGYSLLRPGSWPVSQKKDDNNVDYILLGTLPFEPGSGWLAIKSFGSTTALSRSIAVQKTWDGACKNFVQKKIGDFETIEFSCQEAFAGGYYVYNVLENGGSVFELSYISSPSDDKIVSAMIKSLSFDN